MEASETGDERSDLIPFDPRWNQPLPYQTLVVYYEGRTAISRLWNEGEPERCKLCLECRASSLNCLVVIPDIVPRASAPGFSTRGLRPSDGRLRRSESEG